MNIVYVNKKRVVDLLIVLEYNNTSDIRDIYISIFQSSLDKIRAKRGIE